MELNVVAITHNKTCMLCSQAPTGLQKHRSLRWPVNFAQKHEMETDCMIDS
jgi:hypothetical protein